ncbi:hypothetical protein E2R51_15780 [Jeotgalibacillus sp. S-D1]|uniref:hypothetical protein n=1 Tax=Jeotgalibacillus sp. S-D1 TaxID=2552189 RepID=UPI0010596E92|nr:hypothetical protein [Jeotgalibacillus sp. S-D1]TDL30790.1 hypothetical protein E2R51_15780 [Jeotgalibacillus sp. S-D1]
MNSLENKVAVTLKSVGYFIFILTVIMFFVFVSVIYMDLMSASFLIFIGFVIGLLFIGFGEVIHLLQSIYDKQPALAVSGEQDLDLLNGADSLEQIDGSVVDEVKTELEEFFAAKGKKVTGIALLNKEYFLSCYC